MRPFCHSKWVRLHRDLTGLTLTAVRQRYPFGLGRPLVRSWTVSNLAGTRPRCLTTVTQENESSTLAVPEPTSDHPANPTLRPYQQECIQQCLAHLKRGIRRQAVSLPVGSGKTVVFANLITQIPEPTPGANKTLVLAHREELLHQACRQISRFAPQLSVDLEQGRHRAAPSADVVVASVMTLGRANSLRLQRFDPSRFKCIIIDEAHHIAAASYQRVLQYFDADTPQTSVVVWGCSATLQRHDRKSLAVAFDYITYHRDFLTMIQEKWLCDLKVTEVRTNTDLTKLRTVDGDFAVAQLATRVNTDVRNTMIVRAWKKLATDRRSTLVFAVDVAHVTTLYREFQRYGVSVEMITGSTRPEDRYDILQRFREHQFSVLVNCAILTEGTDIPNIDCVVMARPTRSSVLYQQMVGRGLRLSPGKSECLVIDFVDSLRSGATVLTAPTLTGLAPDTTLDGDTLSDDTPLPSVSTPGLLDQSSANQLGEESDDAVNGQDSLPLEVLFTHHLNPFYVNDPNSNDVPIHRTSGVAWVFVKKGLYAACIKPSSYNFVKQQDDGKWEAFHRRQLNTVNPQNRAKRRYFWAPQETLASNLDTLADAIRCSDIWIQKKYGMWATRQRFQVWRRNPASEAQVEALRKFKLEITSEVQAKLTKGMAGDLLLTLKLGAGKGGRNFLRSIMSPKSAAAEKERTRVTTKSARLAPLTVGPVVEVETI
ncbi:DEAD DEAH box helicase [Dispira parvispora]|uniref:DEAD DEAH box helicase n=1 Tax=Dispira parvispora TaxID=1520584 RepID=A0A9W8AVC3_9FUNG|nr:DEAD DEAH box helicase [Dispira parvispora]